MKARKIISIVNYAILLIMPVFIGCIEFEESDNRYWNIDEVSKGGFSEYFS